MPLSIYRKLSRAVTLAKQVVQLSIRPCDGFAQAWSVFPYREP